MDNNLSSIHDGVIRTVYIIGPRSNMAFCLFAFQTHRVPSVMKSSRRVRLESHPASDLKPYSTSNLAGITEHGVHKVPELCTVSCYILPTM